MGRPIFWVMRSTTLYTRGNCSRVTGWARYVASAILSEKKYAIKFVAVAIISAQIIPLWPPKARPIPINSKVRAVSRKAVLKVFPIHVSYQYRCFPGLGDARGAGPHIWRLTGLRYHALERAFKGLIQCGLRFFIFRLRDVALLVFDFELKEFFLEGFEQKTGTSRRGRCHCTGKFGQPDIRKICA